MGKLRRVLKQVCLLHKEELDFLRGEKERLEAERDEWRGKALDADSANERLHAAMNSGSITINSQGVSAISNGETWTYKAFDLPESGTIQDILIEKNTGLEMAVAILTADRDNLKEAKAKAEYEAQNFAKDRDAWKESYDVLKVDCGPIESRLETKRAIERAEALETELSTRAQQFCEEKRELSITIEDLKDKLTAAINDLQSTRTECTCHTEDNQWYECPVCEIARLKRAGFCVDRSAEKQALEERVKFLEAELDQFDARGIERLKAEMDKADRLKSELEEVRAAFISVTGYKDRVRAVVGNLVKVASSE